MAPSAIAHNGHEGEQDIDLTASAIEHKLNNSGWTLGKSAKPAAPLGLLNAADIKIDWCTSPREVPTPEAANAGTETICTDHMIVAKWTRAEGWSMPHLKPYGPLELMPTASVLHYATECFEGLKCYRGFDKKLRLFRPRRNAERMLMSSLRISLPGFDPAELEKLMIKLLSIDGPRWIPRSRPGTFMYLRPTMIGTQSQLGVMCSREAMLFIICSFMPELDSPKGGMRLHTSPEDMVRAWVGGFGYAKVGANYGPSLLATSEARERGYHQILWLYGKDMECTEAGASNFFVMWKNKETGHPELVTAPLDDRLILDGVTRGSVVELARKRCADVDVVERKYTIGEIIEAHADGRMMEAFATGTAVGFSLSHHLPLHLVHLLANCTCFSTLSARFRRFTTEARISTLRWAWKVMEASTH
jgi:branched-chain amino acid aminotransferase